MARPAAILCTALLLFGGAGQTLDARAGYTSLRVALTAAPTLSTTGRTALIREATRIWQQAGVRLEWIAPIAPVPLPLNTLRVLAVTRPAAQPRGHVWVLGELLRFDDSKAIARLSLPDAERIVVRSGLAAATTPDERVGVVLGRAAAHEIGHYLLDTSTHARAGLMRAVFDEGEFADPHSDAFDLDEHAAAWVRERLADGLPLGPAAHDATAANASLHVRFSYAR